MTAITHPAAAAPQLDWTALLAPLPDGTPEPPREALDAILDAAREDDPNLPQGVWVAEPKKAEWKEVVALATAYLARRGKNLQVAALLLEGLIGLHGFGGVAPGLAVMAGLCQDHWPRLQPLPDDDGDDAARMNIILRLNKRLPLLLAKLPLNYAGAPQAGKPTVCWDDYQRALFATKARLRLGDAAKPGDDSMAAFQSGAGEAPTAVLQGICQHLAQGEAALEHLRTVLLTVCSSERPSLAAAAQAMAEIRNWAEIMLRDRGVLSPPHAAEADGDSDTHWTDDAEENPEEWHGLHFANRQEAYALLAAIADYLAATEPHSPTPYLLRRAVAWGNMPLHELLAELSQGRNDLATVFAMLGIAPQK